MRDSKHRWVRLVALVMALGLVAAACGDDDDAATTTTEAPATTEATTTTAPPETTTTAPPETTTTEAPTTTEEAGFQALYEGELKLGYVLPSTGGLAVIIDALVKPLEMLMSEFEAAGNTSITLLPGDSGTDPQVASVTVEQFINDEVSGIIGPAGTDVSLGVIDRITGSEIPMCSPSNTGAVFTTYDDGGYYFRTAPPDNLQGLLLADLMTEGGAASAAVVYQGTTYGRGLAEAVEGGLEANGVTVTAMVEYDQNATSFDAEAATLAASGADAILVISYAEGAGLMQAMIEAGVGPTDVAVYGADGFKDSVQADAVDPNNLAVLEGVIATGPSVAPPSGEPTFPDRFAAFAPDAPTIFSAHTYDCLMLMVLSAEASGSTDPTAIQAVFNDLTTGGEKCSTYESCHALLAEGADIDYDGAAGPLEFVEVGEPGAGTYDIFVVSAEGTYDRIDTVDVP
jgi:branched-chain amino acid transport system substrate-binding protein